MTTPYHFYYVYVLRSLRFTNRVYIGFTTDLRKRLGQHNAGESAFTKLYTPWRLMYYEAFSKKSDALRRERNLKSNGNSMRELKKRAGLFEGQKSGKGGFTLIEMLVYLGLYAIIMTGALVSVYTIFGSNAHNQAKAMVQEEGAYLIGKIDWVLTNAQVVSAPVVGTPGNTLDGTTYISSLLLPVHITEVGGNVQMSINGLPLQTLNNTNVSISNLEFEHTRASADGLNPESIRATFTISARTSDGLSFSRSFTTLKYLRK